MIDSIIADGKKRMEAAVENLRRELATVRAGRATPALLDKVVVDYHGSPVPINQLATITVPEARMLVIQPWDQSALGDIERAIHKSDLGLTPSNDGKLIRLTLPQLTEERRRELVRQIRRTAEEAKVAVRNVRRDLNDQIKESEREGLVSEDVARRGGDEAQKTTDDIISLIDQVLAAKEKEIMEV